MSLWPLSNSHSHMYVPASCRVAVLIFRLDDNPSMGFTISSSSMVFPSFRQVISPSGVAAEREDADVEGNPVKVSVECGKL